MIRNRVINLGDIWVISATAPDPNETPVYIDISNPADPILMAWYAGSWHAVSGGGGGGEGNIFAAIAQSGTLALSGSTSMSVTSSQIVPVTAEIAQSGTLALSGSQSMEVTSTAPSTDFPVTSGLTGLWDSTEMTGFSDNDLITQWDDLSGNVRHFTAAGGARPTYKTNIINGHPVVRFDGAANGMSSTGHPTTLPLTIVSIVAHANPGTSKTIAGFSASSAACHVGYQGSSGKWFITSGTNLFHNVANTGWNTHSAVFNSASSKYEVDGVQFTGSTGTNNPGGTFRVGMWPNSSQFLAMDALVFAVINRAISDTEINDIESWASTKFGI